MHINQITQLDAVQEKSEARSKAYMIVRRASTGDFDAANAPGANSVRLALPDGRRLR